MLRLTLDERDNLKDLCTHPGFKALDKVLDACAQGREADVLRLNLNSTSDRELIVMKARAEGARQLVADLRMHLTKLRSSTEQTE